MGLEAITTNKLETLATTAKKVRNPGTQEKDKGSHKELNYKASSLDGSLSFSIYTRQNIQIDDDFSCGIIWNMPSGELLTLARYNGSSHDHRNVLEKEKLTFSCHIHRATEAYIKAGKKAEGYAEATDRYKTLKGALHCLLLDYNVQGLSSTEDVRDLFDAN